MGKIYLNKSEVEKINIGKEKNLLKRKKKFFKKKLNHLNNPRLNAFYKHITAKPSDMLYMIKFKSSFSFYLYLYLKSIAEWHPNTSEFRISKPIEVNFGEIQRLSTVVRNTVKKGFKELVEVGLVLYNEDLLHKHHNSTKSVLILSDEYLIGYDDKNKRVIYSISCKS